MPLQKIQFKPGFNKQQTATGAEGQWIEGDNIRFRYGEPQKIGGWQQLNAGTLAGPVREQLTWTALDGKKYAALGTSKILAIYYEGSFYDITPLQNAVTGCTFTSTTGSSTVTITKAGHGLGVAPKFIIFKNRSSATGWACYNVNIGASKYLALNETIEAQTATGVSNSTDPTSSVFSIGTADRVNTNGNTYIAYCFADVKGYSKMGSYTGNGSTDGAFVYTGFKPAYVMSKGSSLASSWNIQTNQLQTYNDGSMPYYKANTTDAELSATNMDFLSNGFKLRTTDNDWNGSGQTYIYMAFAENPFVSSTFIPTTAR